MASEDGHDPSSPDRPCGCEESWKNWAWDRKDFQRITRGSDGTRLSRANRVWRCRRAGQSHPAFALEGMCLQVACVGTALGGIPEVDWGLWVTVPNADKSGWREQLPGSLLGGWKAACRLSIHVLRPFSLVHFRARTSRGVPKRPGRQRPALQVTEPRASQPSELRPMNSAISRSIAC